MTKLEYIKTLSAKDRRDLWDILGKNIITPETKYFAQDMVYKLEINDHALKNGCLLFCKKSYSPRKALDWDNFNTANYNTTTLTGETTFGKNIIDPHFEFILNEDTFNEMQTEYEKNPYEITLVPFEVEGEGEVGGEVKICEKDYENCIKCLGYPFITEDELEYTREEIIDLAIKPSLEEYFHWLPAVRIEEVGVSGSSQLIDVPADAYDVLGVSVQQRGTHGSGNITNTLLRYFDESSYGSYNYAGMTGTYRGTLRPHTISSPVENFISSRALAQANINLNTRVHFEKVITKDEQGISHRQIKVCSNKGGAYNIHWAIRSLNFDDVEYQQRQNMFKYCQAEVMLLFANLRRQAKSDIPGAIDYSGWISEANTMKQEVVADWKQLVKASGIIRGSL